MTKHFLSSGGIFTVMALSANILSDLNQLTKHDCAVIKSILLLGDDVDDADLVDHIISEFDNTVRFYKAWEGSEALEKLKNEKIEIPELILLDINMPGMDGWNFLEAIKAEHKLSAVPVIMYTTSSSKKEIDESKRLGAYGYISKPNEYISTRELFKMLISYPISEYKTAMTALDPEAQRSIHFMN